MNKLIALSLLLFCVIPSASGQTGISINEAKLGKAVDNRQITDETTTFALNDKVYIWLKVSGAGAGEPLPVTWKIGERTYKSSLAVGGSPWRTWSYKIVAVPGDWTVVVEDAKGAVLKELKFTVTK
jgi:hypothetical protein